MEDIGDVYSDTIFRDCYMENNGSLKFHILNKDAEDEDDDIVENDKTKEMTIKSNLKLQENRSSMGKMKMVSGGVFSLYDEELVDNTDQPAGADIEIEKSFFYDDLNLKSFKNYNLSLHQVNTTLFQLQNYRRVFLNMDAVNRAAHEIINRHNIEGTLLKKEDLLMRFPVLSSADEEELDLDNKDLLFLLNIIKLPQERLEEENYLTDSGRMNLNLENMNGFFDNMILKRPSNPNFVGDDVPNNLTKKQKTSLYPYTMDSLREETKQKQLANVNKRVILSNLQKLLVRDEFDSFYNGG